MLQVILFLRLIHFQTGSVCFNPAQFGAGTKHMSQVIVLPIHRVFSTFIKANLRPKLKFLGLILGFIKLMVRVVE